jgi:hypothetical protein
MRCVFFSLAAAAAITGIAAEYSPFSGRRWVFILGAGGTLMFFPILMLPAGIPARLSEARSILQGPEGIRNDPLR